MERRESGSPFQRAKHGNSWLRNPSGGEGTELKATVECQDRLTLECKGGNTPQLKD